MTVSAEVWVKRLGSWEGQKWYDQSMEYWKITFAIILIMCDHNMYKYCKRLLIYVFHLLTTWFCHILSMLKCLHSFCFLTFSIWLGCRMLSIKEVWKVFNRRDLIQPKMRMNWWWNNPFLQLHGWFRGHWPNEHYQNYSKLIRRFALQVRWMSSVRSHRKYDRDWVQGSGIYISIANTRVNGCLEIRCVFFLRSH